jgi:glycosidase
MLAAAFAASSLHAEVILQYFESDWDEIYQRIPEISEAGYDAIWTPPPCKSPEAGTITWGNVGYSLYDRFDLGDTPQRGTLGTRYGTRGDLRNMVDNLHGCDVKIYPDIVANHNGNGPNYLTYPGMAPNDFHVWQDASQPGGWKRASRMNDYDDIANGAGKTFQEELVSLTRRPG